MSNGDVLTDDLQTDTCTTTQLQSHINNINKALNDSKTKSVVMAVVLVFDSVDLYDIFIYVCCTYYMCVVVWCGYRLTKELKLSYAQITKVNTKVEKLFNIGRCSTIHHPYLCTMDVHSSWYTMWVCTTTISMR